jgi:aspartyl-tRNA(Asn)/glutamyl-tRNA(Gln) amidotransferase subunit A
MVNTSGEFATVAELGRLYREGTSTPSDVVEAALEHIARVEPELNAFASQMKDASRAEARQRTQELASGTDLGPLHGIPVAIKDLIEVVGAPTGYGSKVEPPHLAIRDARLVARLRAAGAVILGKTNLLEYAYGVAHPQIGQTNNPHDSGRTAGGSSGGSAAAVASGIVPLAIGTDTGGSIRIPAAYCGIVGLKPSFGLVPMEGVFPLSWSLDHAGPLTRNAADAALALACISEQPIPMASTDIASIRIGVLLRHVSRTQIGHTVTDRFDQVVATLKAAGAEIHDIDLPDLKHANETLLTLLRPEASVIHEALIAANPMGYALGTRSQIEAGAQVSAIDYVKAQRCQTQLRLAVEELFATVDVLISPSVPFVAPVEDPEIMDGQDSEMLASGFANLTGQPSLSLPMGMANGLPAGLQMTGPLGSDARLLSIAMAFEALREMDG